MVRLFLKHLDETVKNHHFSAQRGGGRMRGGKKRKENKHVKILSNFWTGDIWTTVPHFVHRDCTTSTQDTVSPAKTGAE